MSQLVRSTDETERYRKICWLNCLEHNFDVSITKRGHFTYFTNSVITFVALCVLCHFYGVVSGEDPTGTSSHVVALIPVILCLHLHQQRIIYLQLQLIVMSGDKPVETDLVTRENDENTQAFYEQDDHLTQYHKWMLKEHCSEIYVLSSHNSPPVSLKSGSEKMCSLLLHREHNLVCFGSQSYNRFQWQPNFVLK